VARRSPNSPLEKHQPGGFVKRKLRGHDLVGERSRPHEHLHLARAGQPTERGARLGQTREKRFPAMRGGRTGKRRPDFGREGHRTGQEIEFVAFDGIFGERAAKGRALLDRAAKRFDRQIHWLVGGAFGADEGAEDREAEMAVKPELTGGPGDHGDVVAVPETVAHRLFEERGEHVGLAELRLHGEQAYLDRHAPGREVLIEIGNLRIERKRPLARRAIMPTSRRPCRQITYLFSS